MKANNKKAYNGISAAIVILACFIIAICFYKFVLGNPTNFMDNNPANHPLPGNYFGTVYKGGYIVPVVITLFLTVVTLSIERLIAISHSKGKKNLVGFVQTIKKYLEEGNLDAVQRAKRVRRECRQRGSIALQRCGEFFRTDQRTKDIDHPERDRREHRP